MSLCRRCGLGRYISELVTYTEWYGDEAILVLSDVPADVCTYCGDTHFGENELEAQLLPQPTSLDDAVLNWRWTQRSHIRVS